MTLTRHLIVLLPMTLFGCDAVTGGTGGTGGNGGNGGGLLGGGYNSGIDFPSTGFPARDADETYTGDLSDGSTISLGWAESNYCWVATENVNFDGSHVFHEFDQPIGEDLYFLLTPDSGVDVSIYSIQFGAGGLQTPPDITSSPFDCIATYDQTNDSNPGQAEAHFVLNYRAFDVLLGIAGAGASTSGGYTLEVWREAGTVFDQE